MWVEWKRCIDTLLLTHVAHMTLRVEMQIHSYIRLESRIWRGSRVDYPRASQPPEFRFSFSPIIILNFQRTQPICTRIITWRQAYALVAGIKIRPSPCFIFSALWQECWMRITCPLSIHPCTLLINISLHDSSIYPTTYPFVCLEQASDCIVKSV